MVFASTAGCALSENKNTFMPTMPSSLINRTIIIALASAVLGRKAVATNADSDERIALKTDRSRGEQMRATLGRSSGEAAPFQLRVQLGICPEHGVRQFAGLAAQASPGDWKIVAIDEPDP
jgi:hypothetical protein